MWVTLQCLSRSELLIKMAEHVQLVSLQCLSRSESLTKVAEYISSLWVALHHLNRLEPLMITCTACESLFSVWATHENGWMHIQFVSHPPAFEKNHWWEWLNICPVCESLSSVWADQNYWQEWLSLAEHISSEWVTFQCLRTADKNSWTHVQHKSCSPVFENHWQDQLNLYPVCELLSSIWLGQNHWQEWLNANPESESLSNVWLKSLMELEWLNTHPVRESISGVWADETQKHWQEWLNTRGTRNVVPWPEVGGGGLPEGLNFFYFFHYF